MAAVLGGMMLLSLGAATAGPAMAANEPRTELYLRIRGFQYFPNNVDVTPGAQVSVRNFDWRRYHAPHTVSSYDGLFETGLIRGGTKEFNAPMEPGHYRYFCAIHPFMSGSIIVVDTAG